MDFEPWIGVYFDGTLAHYEGWIDDLTFGKPVELMAKRIRLWVGEGKRVKVITSRVAPRPIDHPEQASVVEIRTAIENWCERYIGTRLDVTNWQEPNMVEIWGDRCVPVEKNTGKRLYTPREFV